MSVFDKVSLVVGKIVIFLLAFLSCFYTVDLLCTYLSPIIAIVLTWFIKNRVVVVLGSFAIIVAFATAIYLISDDNYRKVFNLKPKFHSKVKNKKVPVVAKPNPVDDIEDLNLDD